MKEKNNNSTAFFWATLRTPHEMWNFHANERYSIICKLNKPGWLFCFVFVNETLKMWAIEPERLMQQVLCAKQWWKKKQLFIELIWQWLKISWKFHSWISQAHCLVLLSGFRNWIWHFLRSRFTFVSSNTFQLRIPNRTIDCQFFLQEI